MWCLKRVLFLAVMDILDYGRIIKTIPIQAIKVSSDMIYQYSTQARTLLVQKFEWTGINSCTTQQSIGTYIKLQDNKIENKNYHNLCMLIITKHFT